MKQLKPAILPPRRPPGALPLSELPTGIPAPLISPPPGMPAVPLAARPIVSALEGAENPVPPVPFVPPAAGPVDPAPVAPVAPPAAKTFVRPAAKTTVIASTGKNVPVTPSVPAPAKPAAPRFRYFTTPPTHISLALGDLAVPESFRTPQWDSQFVVQLPCESIFASSIPKISLSRLADLVPDQVAAEDSPESVTLPVGKLARAYFLIEQSERLPDPEPEPEPVPLILPEPPVPMVSSLPVADAPVAAAPEEPVSKFAPPAPVIAPVDIEEKPEPVAEPAPMAEIPQMETPVVVQPPEPKTPTKRPTLFSGLPLFRRKAVAAPVASVEPAAPEPSSPLPPVPPPGAISPFAPPASPLFQHPGPEETASSTPEVSIPAEPVDFAPPVPADSVFSTPSEAMPSALEDTTHFSPVETSIPVDFAPAVPVESTLPAPVEVETPAPADFAPPALPAGDKPLEESSEAAVPMVFTEHLPPHQASETVSQEQLQALFMTEEVLTVQRVVELCGALPGVKSCILARRGAVIASHNVPANIDPISLSSHGMDMLQAMRDSSRLMGLGSIPAVTIHSEKGPVSFLQHDLLCFLIIHRERGFVPGVREKLSDVLREVTRANLQLPVSGQSG